MATALQQFVQRGSWLLAGALVFALGAAAAAPPAPEHYARRPMIDDVVISPVGNRLAVLVFAANGRRALGVMDLDPVSEMRVVGAFDDADVTEVRWVNNERLVYEGFVRGPEIRAGQAGTFAVDHDGSNRRTLIAWRRGINETSSTIRSRTLPYGWFLLSPVDDVSDDVFVVHRSDDAGGDLKQLQLGRLNTRTGVLTMINYGMPEGIRDWLLDAKREPRMLTTYRAGRVKIYWRAPGSDTWAEVADFDPLNEAGFQPWLIDSNGDLLVTARHKGDTSSVFRFDPSAKRIEPEPVLRIAGFDLAPEAVVDTKTNTLVGVHLRADRPMSVWFDAGLAGIQRGVDQALPTGRFNRLYCGRCESSRFIVIRSSSDRHPGEYFLFDRVKSSMERIGAARPWIQETNQGSRSFHRVPARDGLLLPLYVTHPSGAAPDKPLPGVVVVHGGPWVRGTDRGWEAEAQFLASRGYRVLEPEFRGSEGYGFNLFRAGWKEWGRKMQLDLEDAVQWAAKQGLINPARVCVMGGSYGGYAALMAPITTPEAFQCAASFAGVTDIMLMYDISWSDLSLAARQYSMPTLIGDPVMDAEQLAATSPLKRAAEIKIPVLLAHGAADRRVPIDHAKQFVEAARRGGVRIEPVYYTNEGHGFFDPANQADYFGRVERFLENSLKPPR